MAPKKTNDILRRQRVFLVEHIDAVNKNLLDHLFSREVLSRTELERLRQHRVNSERVEELLDLLPRKDDYAFTHFCQALRLSEQSHVAQVLEDELGKEGISTPTKTEIVADSVKLKNALRDLRVRLTEDLEPRSVMDHLVQDSILTFGEVESIMSNRTRRDQTRSLLDMLSLKGANGLVCFQKALRATLQSHLAAAFQDALARQEFKNPRIPNSSGGMGDVTVSGPPQDPFISLPVGGPTGQTSGQLNSLPLPGQMPTGVANPAPPKGYSKELILGNVEEKYLCSQCELVLRNPVQSFCGHRFCSECIEYLLGQSEGSKPVHCPSCTKENADNEYSILQADQKFPDNAIKRDFATLRSKCLNEGCDWEGTFRAYEKHDRECAFKTAQCKCGQLIPQAQLADHVKNDCPMRQIKCRYCEEDIIFCEQQEHEEICPKYPLTCESCGKVNILREQMEEHVDPNRGDCTSPKIHCKYGCQKMVDVDKLEEHNRAAVHNHVEKISTSLQGAYEKLEVQNQQLQRILAIETVPARVARLEHEVETIKTNAPSGGGARGAAAVPAPAPAPAAAAVPEDSTELGRRVQQAEQKTNAFEQIAAVMNRQIERAGKTINDLERQRRLDRDLIESMDRKLRSYDRAMAMKDVAISELTLRVQSLELTSYDSVLTWKISDFARRRGDAINARTTSLYSPVFYTSKQGYKMCARIYLNGDGMGKGTHVSLFFVVMRGEYDALLTWPFKQKVTLALLDQNRKQDVVDAFRPDPTSSSFRRPTSDMNIASGCPLFMPLSMFDDSARAYVKDDVVFVRVTVDTGDSH